MTAAQAIVEILAAAGIGRLYTVPGESFLGILDAADADPRFSVISCRHESGAAFMAEAEAKLTGVPAVAAGTRGVGAANLAIGVHTAMQDATPMIVLLGQVETGFLGKEAFQEVDLPAFYRPITKWAATIDHASRAPDLVAQAVRRATTGRPGPVMLALPADMLGEEVDPEAVAAAVRAVQGRRAPSVPEASAVTAVADALRAARQPVLIAGAGCRDARAELIECAERWNVGVYAAFRRQDVFPNDHPHYLGHLGLGTPAALPGCAAPGRSGPGGRSPARRDHHPGFYPAGARHPDHSRRHRSVGTRGGHARGPGADGGRAAIAASIV